MITRKNKVKSNEILDRVIHLRGKRITNIFIGIVGQQLGARAKIIWQKWKEEHYRLSMIQHYINTLAEEIQLTSLREEFIKNASKVTKQKISELEIIKGTKETSGPIISRSLTPQNPNILACINGEGL